MTATVLRKTSLTVHVLASVGWVGSVLAFVSLAWVGLKATDPERIRGAYLAARVVIWTVIVPLSAASLLSGVVQSLATSWGLFRHYWVVAKLLLGVVAGALLLVHTGPVDAVARWAHARAAPGGLQHLRLQLVVDAALGLGALGLLTALSVFKPRGLTPYGWRRSNVTSSGRGPGTAGGSASPPRPSP